MHRRYKVRLGDGTVLLVDQAGLTTWRVDAKAMVQGAKGKWRPLKDVLAMQQAAAKHVTVHDPSVSAAPPLIPPPPREHKPSRDPVPPPSRQESGASAALPLIPPPPRAPKPPRGPAAASSDVMAKAPTVSKRAGTKALKEEPRKPGAPLLSESIAPSEPPHLEAWADEPAIPSSESFPQPSPPDEEVGVVPSQPLDDEAPPILDTFSLVETPRVATSEPLDLRALAEETLSQVSPPVEVEEVEAIPSAPIADEVPEIPAPSPWHEPVEASPVPARPSLQALADDPAPRAAYTRERPALDDGLPSIPLKPVETRDEEYADASTRPGVYESEPDDFVERRARGNDLEQQSVQAVKAFAEFLSRSAEQLGHVYRTLQPMVRGALARLPEVLARTRDVLAALREAVLKRRAARSSRSVPQKPPPSLDLTPEVPAQELGEWPALISSPSVPQEPRPSLVVAPEVTALAQEPTEWRSQQTGRRAIADEEIPEIQVKPVRDYGAPRRAVRNLFRAFGSGASAWALGLKGRVEGLVRRKPPGTSVPRSEAAEPSPPYWAPREPLKAPLSVSELPVIRLAKIDEPEEVEDLYEGATETVFHAGWVWTKRVALLSALVAGGVLAVQTREAWFPKAAQLGGVAFTETGKYIEAREQEEHERRALQQATAQLPHLAPDTIRLVMSQSPTGVFDPPGVFQAACDAADRGLLALDPGEALELTALRNALLETLSPAEGERVREYEEVRARRLPFDFEDRTALELVARGARALPPDSRQRLQELFGKAIAAGLPRRNEGAHGAVAVH